IILLLIILQFIDDRKVAFLAILPFVFFPSAMTWYTQIHKDGYFILGNLLFLYGWLLLIEIIRENGKWQEIFIRVLLIELGTFFIWLVRPYGVQIIQGLTFIINVVISILLVCLFLKKRIPLKKMLITILLCWMVLVMITPFTKGGIDTGEPIVQVYWVNSRWIPDFIESKFYHLSKVREGYSDKYQEAGSNIDINIHFHSMNDVFGFIPRAMEIILFAPFPNDWLGEGTTDWNTIMRRISGFEMIIVYISLFSLIFFMINNWRNVKFWLLLYFCMGMMLIYGLTIPNIGSLYRVRYGFLLTVVAFGWVELTFFFRKKSLL
ncbi:MAG: hypothetical protein GX428_10935, partial [Candidatus Atribacteria bacterium]|nr:hypothetical protein [Candidatus Atribacteria bacterium]